MMSCDLLCNMNRLNCAYKAEFNNLSECSLNFRMRGSAPFCLPACIVMSFLFPVY